MARSFVLGNNDRIVTSTAPVTAYPWTIACWVYVASVGGAANQNFWNFTKAGSGSNDDTFGVGWDHVTGTIEGFASDDTAGGGNFSTLHVGSAISANTWYPIVWVGTNATSRTLYILQGGSIASATDTTSIVNNNHNATAGSMGFFGTVVGVADFGGRLAEAALWNVALTAGEATGYCLGIRAGRIRPGALKTWLALDGQSSPEPDYSGLKNSGTVTGTGSAFGPPFNLFTPWRPQFLAPPPVFTPMPQIVM